MVVPRLLPDQMLQASQCLQQWQNLAFPYTLGRRWQSYLPSPENEQCLERNICESCNYYIVLAKLGEYQPSLKQDL